MTHCDTNFIWNEDESDSNCHSAWTAQVQGCQLSRIDRDTHTFWLYLTLSCWSFNISRMSKYKK